ncbi:MAG TPA: two-component regulator propeller domain-containing protein [Blastocatellia bacterium]|nr:two-component regulator propeller domain-containing protein [Blastocatellia bacterium]
MRIFHPPFATHLGCLRFLFWLSVALCSWCAVRAERLPVKSYTSADGLAQNNANRIVFDSRGFLWICTNEGLSRFDGYKFNNFGIEQGLPHRGVNDLLETRTGEYWLATNGGLVLFNPDGFPGKPGEAILSRVAVPMFRSFAPNNMSEKESLFVTSLLEDRQGMIWCGTKAGLLRLRRNGPSVEISPTELWRRETKEFSIESLMEDRNGVIWAGSIGKVFRLLPDGKIERYTTHEGLPDIDVMRLYQDRQGTVWCGTGKGLLEFVRSPVPGKPLVSRMLTSSDGLPGPWVRDIWQAEDGTYWIATDRGLANFSRATEGQSLKITVFTKENGLSDYYIKQVIGDRYGNIWVGTPNAGIMKLFVEGFTTIGYEDGLSAVNSVIQSKTGELYFLGYVRGSKLNDLSKEDFTKANASALYWRIGHFDGQHFTWVRPNVPRGTQFSWGWNQVSFQDSHGEWWIATRDGLYRFPRVNRVVDLAHIAPKMVYTTAHGLTSNQIIRLFEDSRGDVWISTSAQELNGIHKWERATEQIRNLTLTPGLPSLRIMEAISYREDRGGNLWIGFASISSRGAVVRYRNGRFTVFEPTQGAPASNIVDLFLDSSGKLWIGTNVNGLFRVDEPEKETPVFVNYTTTNGLSSNRITGVIEDQQNRIYLGSGRGVDRLDQQTGSIRHFNQADGLPLGGIDDVLRDQTGNIWFATTQGLARFIPPPSRTYAAPRILIDNLRVRGVRYPLSALGANAVKLPELKTEENHIGIEFVALSLASGDILQYQYKLEDVDVEWGAPTLQRSINYANLAPGNYRFLVRAINADGVMSEEPATLRFTILRPLWQRWWFLSLLVLTLGGLFYGAYRYRVAQIVALERVRLRIASDLHDDVGANLSLIAGVSEMLAQQAQQTAPQMQSQLALLAESSRRSMDAMSDIVWMINPNRDHLRDLAQRLRRFANETLTPRQIEVKFTLPDSEADIPIAAESRREIFLIGKEAINNIVRHAACTEAEIALTLDGTMMTLRVRDNGRGFDSSAPNGDAGQGLLSMRSRAAKLGGELLVNSQPGSGTEISLRARLDQHELSERTRKHL